MSVSDAEKIALSTPAFDLNTLSQQLINNSESGFPPVDQWHPEFCGDIDMRIAGNGQWFYMGTPIGRQRMVELFARVLWREEGRYFLKTPVEKIGIQVDRLPFLITAVEAVETEQGMQLWFTSSTGDHICAGPDHPLRVHVNDQTGEPEPAIHVRFGMEGLIARPVFYQLVEMATLEMGETGEQLIIESAGERFSLGQL
ncbi:MAG: DUF1285 domain-containing protein [Marinobacterium sp.]|nr:DUF1285 domain-containing protein [Marinobacterium sp.]